MWGGNTPLFLNLYLYYIKIPTDMQVVNRHIWKKIHQVLSLLETPDGFNLVREYLRSLWMSMEGCPWWGRCRFGLG